MLDLTNSKNLDVSPFVDRYSNAIALSSAPKTATTTFTTTTNPRIIESTTTSVKPRVTSYIAPKPRIIADAVNVPVEPIFPTPILSPVTLAAPTGYIVAPTATTAVAPTAIVAPTVATATTATRPVPTGAGSMSGGGFGGGGGATEGASEKQEGEEGTEGAEVEKTERLSDKSNKNSMLGLIIGAVGGYFYAKQNNKNLIAFTLIGSALGMGIGVLIDKKK